MFVSSCSGLPPSDQSTASKGSINDRAISRGLKKFDLIRNFGEPLEKSSSGSEYWIYKMRGHLSGGEFINDYGESLMSLRIYFDGDRVASVSRDFIDNHNESDAWILVGNTRAGSKWVCIYDRHGMRKTVKSTVGCSSVLLQN